MVEGRTSLIFITDPLSASRTAVHITIVIAVYMRPIGFRSHLVRATSYKGGMSETALYNVGTTAWIAPPLDGYFGTVAYWFMQRVLFCRPQVPCILISKYSLLHCRRDLIVFIWTKLWHILQPLSRKSFSLEWFQSISRDELNVWWAYGLFDSTGRKL